MHGGNWNNDGMGGGSWWLMAIIMILLFGGTIWIAVTLIRHGAHNAQPQVPGMQPPTALRQAPQEILGERLARGEIEPDDYRQRLDALRHQQDK